MRHTCRDYQEEDVEAIIREWLSVRATLYSAATGLGKTFVMTEVVERRLPKRALLLAHRSELIWQARNSFLRRGIECEVEKGELTAGTSIFNRAPVVLATVQTMSSGKENYKRMQRFDPMDFDTLLYDECHHSVSAGNKKIVKYFLDGNPNIKVLGVTATPDRADEEALGQLFETTAAERDILFGVDNGWLVEPLQLMVHVGSIDLSHIGTRCGDLNGEKLAAIMEAEEPAQKVVQATLECQFGLKENALSEIDPKDWGAILLANREPKRTIVFTVSVRQAEMVSNIFNRVIPGISNWLCGKTKDDERTSIFSSFDSGATSTLVNCGVTTEGYDNPFVELISVARPTLSRSLYAQMIGRGTRPLPGIVDGLANRMQRLLAIARSAKPRVTILDFEGNSGKHKLVTTADILGGNVSDEAVKSAKERAKKSEGPVDMRRVLKEEERKILEEMERQRRAEEARKAKLVAKARYSTTTVNPFDVLDLTPATKSKGWDKGKVLSEAQTNMLLKQGIDPKNMTFTQAKQIINELFRRWKGKLCTMKQSKLLKAHGYETKEMTMDNASQLITQLKANGWRRSDLDGVVEGE